MNLLRLPYLWVLLLSVLIIIAFIIYRSRRSSFEGFKDVLKNPEILDTADFLFEEARRQTEAAQQWSDSEVRATVRKFILKVKTGEDAWMDRRILNGLGPRVLPAVLEILGDISLRARLVKPTGVDILPEAPFNRACDLLGDTPPAEAIPLIVPFLDEPSEEIKIDAALVLGKTGADEALPHLIRILNDSNERFRQYALMGLEFAIRHKQPNDECRKSLYPEIERLLINSLNADNAAGILLALDQQRTMDLFLSDSLFTPDHPALHYNLEALIKARVLVPRDRLLTLIQQLETGELKYPDNYSLSAALRLLGQIRLPEDREFLEARLNHNDEEIAEGAAAGLIASHGLEGFEDRLWEKLEKTGPSSLSPPERFYIAIIRLDGEINNGGLSQYFLNNSGDSWRDALTGLDAIGAKERAAVLRDAIRIFGKTPPSEDCDTRREHLSLLIQENEDAFDKCDSRYYKSSEVIMVLLRLYVLKHAEYFAP